MTTSAKWKWAAAAAMVLVLAIAGRELPLLDWLRELTGSIRALGAWGVVLFALGYAVAAMLCVPCMPLTIAGGFIFGTAAGLGAVHGGTALAAAVGFLVGRWLGRGRVAEWLRHRDRFRFLNDAIAEEGWKVVGLLRMLPIAFGPSNYLYGMTGVKFWPYLLTTVLAMLPGNAIFVYLGSVGGRSFGNQGGVQPLQWLALGMGFASLIALGIFVPKILRKHRGLKPSERADGRSPQADAGEKDASRILQE